MSVSEIFDCYIGQSTSIQMAAAHTDGHSDNHTDNSPCYPHQHSDKHNDNHLDG